MSSPQTRRYQQEGREVDAERPMGMKTSTAGPNGAPTMAKPKDPMQISREWHARTSLLRLTAECPRVGITRPTATTAGGIGHLG